MKTAVVNWPKIDIEYVKPGEWNATIDSLIRYTYLKQDGTFPTRKYSKFVGLYSFFEYNTSLEIQFLDPNTGCPRRLRCDKGATGNADNQQEGKLTGYECYMNTEHIWQEKNSVRLSLFSALSGRKYVQDYTDIKKCVPIQISYINPHMVGRRTLSSKCYKADVSSAFPYQMTKKLPTLHDSIKVQGRVNPTSEYPFAFYLKSHHMAIYNELDTRALFTPFYPKYGEVYDDSIKYEEEETILCKEMPQKYSLKETFEYLYEHRKENADLKLTMNATIGFFHKNTNPALSFIAATVIARNNVRMTKLAQALVDEGNAILYIATDCIVWQGNESKLATEEKHLGTFTYEGKRGNFYGWIVGAYQYIDENGVITTKATYIENGPKKDKLKFGELPPPGNNNLFGYMVDTKTGKIVEL